MVAKNGASTRSRSNRKRLRYFYLNSHLHRVLSISRPQDLVVAWNYPEGKRVAYVYSDLRKRMGKAYTLSQVATMIGRHRVIIENYIIEGKIRRPQQAYTLDERRKPGKFLFSESDIFELHDYLLTVHVGRPRKDGGITPGKMPSKAELRAMMQHDTVMYVKTDEGFVPVWKEPDW